MSARHHARARSGKHARLPGLDDDTLQTLYGIGLRLEYCIALLDSSPDQVRVRLDGIIDTVGEVIAELRGHVREGDGRGSTDG